MNIRGLVLTCATGALVACGGRGEGTVTTPDAPAAMDAGVADRAIDLPTDAVTVDVRTPETSPTDGSGSGESPSYGPFTTSTAWATFDLTPVDSDARGLAGGVFDGRYVY